MHVYTVATDNRGYLDALITSCERAGMKLDVLGFDKKWGGFVWRYDLIKTAIASETTPQDSSPADEYTMILDGYDTIVCSNKDELIAHHKKQCEILGLDPEITLFMAPEHHRKWCSVLFDVIWHNASKIIFNVPISNPYVINAGVVMGKRTAVLKYIETLQREAERCNVSDDQRIVNTLYYKDKIDPRTDGFAIHVDTTGGIAYCHANREFLRFWISQSIDHNRHYIDHRKDLDLSVSNVIRLKQTGQKIGVLHAIANADVDQLCAHMNNLPTPTVRKIISQPALRVGMILIKMTVSVLILTLLYNVVRECLR